METVHKIRGRKIPKRINFRVKYGVRQVCTSNKPAFLIFNGHKIDKLDVYIREY